MRILIVDDSTYIRSTIRTTLESNDFEVVGEAGNGEAAIDMIAELKPDVVTLDNILPDMTGVDILNTLSGTPNIPYVVMISAVGQESAMEEAREVGAKHYLVKPFDHNELVKILKSIKE